MRKYFLFALAAIVSLVFAACSEEVLSYNQSDEEVDVVYSINTQSQTTTRALHDGDGEAAKVNRFICEVWLVNGETSSLYKRVEQGPTEGTTTKTNFNLRLVASQTYKVLFWADCANDDLTDKYYVTNNANGLQDVAIKLDTDNKYRGNNDAMDAFYAVDEIEKLNGSITKPIVLKRPFAQLNVITTDIDDIKASSMSTSMEPDQVTLTLNAPTKFNVMEETASDEAEIEYTAGVYYKISNKTQKTTESDQPYNTADSYCTLAMSYIFAPADEKAVETVSIAALKGLDEITSVDFANIPLQRNYRTNIIGDLLTDGVTYNVTIVPAFTTPDNDVYWTKVATVAEAVTALANGTATNVEVLNVPTADNTDFTIPTIFAENNNVSIGIKLPETDKKITFKYDNDTNKAKAPANINIETGTNSAENVVIECTGSHITLNGVFKNVEASTNTTSLIIDKDTKINGTLTVKEGGVEIHGSVNALVVSPATGKTVVFRACEGLSQTVYEAICNDEHNYIDPNFKGVQDGDKWNIVTNDFYQDKQNKNLYHIVSADGLVEFSKQVNAGNAFNGKTIKLDCDIDLKNEEWEPIGLYRYRPKSNETAFEQPAKSFQGTFDGQNYVISNLKMSVTEGGKAYQGAGLFGYTTGDAIIKNIKITNVAIEGRLYVGAIVGYPYTAKSIENCHVNGDIKIEASWYCGGIAGYGYVNIKDCSAIGNESSYIRGCTSGKGNIYGDDYCGYFGGIIGFMGEGVHITENCIVKNLTITADCNGIAGINGILHYGNIVRNCILENTSIVLTETADDDELSRLGLVGGGNNGNQEQPGWAINNIITNSTASYNGEQYNRLVGYAGSGNPSPVYVAGWNVALDASGKKVTAGTFQNIPTELVAEGKSATQNEDGTYTVK